MKKSVWLMLIFVLTNIVIVLGQNDTIKNPNANLLDDLSAREPGKSPELLPGHMMLTQRLFWGEKGLMRSFHSFKLSPEEREKELKVRRTMLVTHQAVGLGTLGCMVAQGILGYELYKAHHLYHNEPSDAHTSRYLNLLQTHRTMALITDLGYLTTASLALFAPPKMIDERKGYSNIKVHKILAIIHFTGLVATNILAAELYNGERNGKSHESMQKLIQYHRAAAITTFGSFAAAMIIIKF